MSQSGHFGVVSAAPSATSGGLVILGAMQSLEFCDHREYVGGRVMEIVARQKVSKKQFNVFNIHTFGLDEENLCKVLGGCGGREHGDLLRR